jgi:hypothetical protein
MLHARTRELALLAGRPPPQVAQADYEQAKRELIGEWDRDRQEAILHLIYEESVAPGEGEDGRETRPFDGG